MAVAAAGTRPAAATPWAAATLRVVMWAAAHTLPDRVISRAAATSPRRIMAAPTRTVAGFAGHTGYVGGHGYSTGWRGGVGRWLAVGAAGAAAPGAAATGMAAFGRVRFTGQGSPGFYPFCRWRMQRTGTGGVPYYYANDVYYTWNPTYDGYVATDPPPVADSSGSADVGATRRRARRAPRTRMSALVPAGLIPGQIFMYPKNGQSAEQQATDRAECQKWASEQAGPGCAEWLRLQPRDGGVRGRTRLQRSINRMGRSMKKAALRARLFFTPCRMRTNLG